MEMMRILNTINKTDRPKPGIKAKIVQEHSFIWKVVWDYEGWGEASISRTVEANNRNSARWHPAVNLSQQSAPIGGALLAAC